MVCIQRYRSHLSWILFSPLGQGCVCYVHSTSNSQDLAHHVIPHREPRARPGVHTHSFRHSSTSPTTSITASDVIPRGTCRTEIKAVSLLNGHCRWSGAGAAWWSGTGTGTGAFIAVVPDAKVMYRRHLKSRGGLGGGETVEGRRRLPRNGVDVQGRFANGLWVPST